MRINVIAKGHYCRCQQIRIGDLPVESLWSYPLSHDSSSAWYLMKISRAANSHALSVSLTHFTTFSRSHADVLISHVFFFFFCLSEVCDVLRVPLLCACKIEAKILRLKKKSVGSSTAFFGTCATLYAGSGRPFANLTPSSHPMLAALDISQKLQWCCPGEAVRCQCEQVCVVWWSIYRCKVLLCRCTFCWLWLKSPQSGRRHHLDDIRHGRFPETLGICYHHCG